MDYLNAVTFNQLWKEKNHEQFIDDEKRKYMKIKGGDENRNIYVFKLKRGERNYPDVGMYIVNDTKRKAYRVLHLDTYDMGSINTGEDGSRRGSKLVGLVELEEVQYMRNSIYG